MEINNEIRCKVFAQYYKANLIICEPNIVPVSHYLEGIDFCLNKVIAERVNYDPSWIKLILKPLSSITDEDAIECAILEGLVNAKVSQRGVGGVMLKDDTYELLLSFDAEICLYKNGLKNNPTNSFLIYQYLISKGYDVPQYLLRNKTLHESGLAIYENEN